MVFRAGDLTKPVLLVRELGGLQVGQHTGALPLDGVTKAGGISPSGLSVSVPDQNVVVARFMLTSPAHPHLVGEQLLINMSSGLQGAEIAFFSLASGRGESPVSASYHLFVVSA